MGQRGRTDGVDGKGPVLRYLMERRGTLRRLGGYLWEDRGLLTGGFFMTIASNLLALLGPLLSGYAVDAVLYFIGSFVLWAFGADGNGQPEGGKENEGGFV